MEKFKSFTEEKGKPYKLVVFNHHGETVRDVDKEEGFTDNDKVIMKSAKEAGIKLYMVDFIGGFLSTKNGKRYLNSFPINEDGLVLPEKGKVKYQTPIELNKEDTLIMPRGLGTLGFTSSRGWSDMISDLELDGFTTIPSIKCWDNCSSKYFTDILCKKAGLRTPKTVALSHSEDSERAVKELGSKFPIILKSSTGTQTGIGVTIVESMRSLNGIVQMILLYGKYLPIIIQEYIPLEYDVRVMVLDDKIIGAMKRNVITDDSDFRSNISLGAKAELIELTELEKKDSITAAKAVDGRLVGIDFIPAKNREKEKPYILEVNSMPGFSGIEGLKKGLVQEILEHFKDRTTTRRVIQVTAIPSLPCQPRGSARRSSSCSRTPSRTKRSASTPTCSAAWAATAGSTIFPVR